MGRKEYLQKELDLLLEKLRFWRYVVFGIISGVIGIMFGVSQGKVVINGIVFTLLFMAFIGIVISIVRLSSLTKEYQNNLKLLKKEE